MNGFSKLILAGLLSLFSVIAQAQDIPLKDLTEGDFKNVVGEMSANFLHTTVSGAGTLGTIWGFEVGLIGGMTKTPDIDALVKRADTSASVDQIYHGALFGAVTVPLAITVEAGLIPKVGSETFKAQTTSLAVKWTPSELFFDLPLDLGVKAHVTKSTVEFKDDINGVATNFDYGQNQLGLTLLASKSFVVVEPFAGIGLVSSKGDLDVSGSTQVFDNSYTTGQSASVKRSGMMWLVGAQVKLLVFHLGAEYTNLYGTSRYTGKLSFAF